ncbi:MAG: tyrosine recombinase [Candidatus Nanopelagicales bacterium]
MIANHLDIFLSHLSIERGLSKNTIEAYRNDLLALDKFLNDGSRSLNAESIKIFLHESKNSISTSDRQLSCFKTFFRYLIDDGLITNDPTAGLHSRNKVMRLPKSLSHEQVTTLLSQVPRNNPSDVRNLLILELLYGTGVRISEAIAIDLEDLDLENKWIKVKYGKGAKQRLVPIGKELAATLDKYLIQARPELLKNKARQSALLVSRRGTRITRQAAWLIIKSAGQMANLPIELTPHSLRHTFATHLLAGGADIRVVQELLGHSVVTTTQIYTKVNIDQIRDTFLIAHPRAG